MTTSRGYIGAEFATRVEALQEIERLCAAAPEPNGATATYSVLRDGDHECSVGVEPCRQCCGEAD